MIWPVLLSGFVLGAVGSLHCVGMCGPLTLVLPLQHLAKAKKFLSLLSYQAGRMITYSILGSLLGLAGHALYIVGYQQVFSLCLGILILVMSVVYYVGKHSVRPTFLNRAGFINALIAKVLRRANGPFGFLMFGMVNGLLPCGMVYIALLSSLSLGEVVESAGFMAMFGLGTMPAMMAAAYAIQKLKLTRRHLIRRIIPYAVAVTGLLLILRGLNLGIPFISPGFPGLPSENIVCHPSR